MFYGKKVAAFDLDGTITQHRTPISDGHIALLSAMSGKYRLLIVGAGTCQRIFEQLRKFPVDIIGCYGMQYCTYNAKTKTLDTVYKEKAVCDKASVLRRAREICDRNGYTNPKGELVCVHESGAVTIALLGSDADIKNKLAFDPDRKKRRAFYGEVVDAFPDYNVFVGGSSSFDMSPKGYDKYHALDRFCRDCGYSHSDIVYFGDDYGDGGNDECVYKSDFDFEKIDDFTKLGETLAPYINADGKTKI